MAQRRHHYERGFEAFLRARRVPYIAVNEARKALLPESARLAVTRTDDGRPASIKSFDFVVYGPGPSLLVDIKGRRTSRATILASAGVSALGSPANPRRPSDAAGRLESWVTLEDVESLERWESLFGPGFEGVFVFVYWCDGQPPDALFQEVYTDQGRWYAVRAVSVREFRLHMRVRSPRWGTVHLSRSDFERLSHPFRLGVGG